MKLAFSMLALAAIACSTPVQADVLARVKDSGVIRIGVRADTGALSYSYGEGKYGGFHHDLCLLVVHDLEKQLGRKIEVQQVAVTSQTRIPSITGGAIEMECGATTNNAMRQKDVAFAVTTYVEEVRVVVKANSGIASIAQLNGKTVATTSGTTTVQLLRKHERAGGVEFKETFAKSDAQSFAMLGEGKADAYAMDGQILASFISASKNPADYRILGEVLSVEPIAIMLPKDEPAFKKAVDETLKAAMRSGEIQKIYNKWFMQPIPPAQAKVGLPTSAATKKAWAEPNDKPVELY